MAFLAFRNQDGVRKFSNRTIGIHLRLWLCIGARFCPQMQPLYAGNDAVEQGRSKENAVIPSLKKMT
jgi:hypothetical protein